MIALSWASYGAAQSSLHVTFLRILRALRIGRVLRRVKVLLLRWDMAAAAAEAEPDNAPGWVGRNRRPGEAERGSQSGDGSR